MKRIHKIAIDAAAVGVAVGLGRVLSGFWVVF